MAQLQLIFDLHVSVFLIILLVGLARLPLLFKFAQEWRAVAAAAELRTGAGILLKQGRDRDGGARVAHRVLLLALTSKLGGGLGGWRLLRLASQRRLSSQTPRSPLHDANPLPLLHQLALWVLGVDR